MGGMEDKSYLLVTAFTIGLSWALTGLATWYAARTGLLDHPGERHSHRVPTPRGGGAGLVLALTVVTALIVPATTPSLWRTCILPGVVVLAVTGWWDDHRSLGAGFRFLVQLSVTFYLLVCASGSEWAAGPVQLIAAGVFIVWMTNLYNFMDGSNGMAGLQGVFSGCVLMWLFARGGDADWAMVSLLVAAVCAGFLPWNLPRARVFMGDVGSLALGFSFGALLVSGAASGAFSLPVALLVLPLFLVDATMTLLARVLRGERWYNAHRQHLYQRLIEHGWSHGRVAAFYQVINVALVLPAIWGAVHFPGLAWPVALILLLGLCAGWYALTEKLRELAPAG